MPEGLGLAGGDWCDQELSANCRDQEQRKLKKNCMLDEVFSTCPDGRRESSFEDGRCKVPSVGAVKSAECDMMPVGSGMVPLADPEVRFVIG